MYGATEATARMAYLPPELAQSRPTSIGSPIPGGSFTLEPLDGWADPDVGELVYHGPNVMMGYAHSPADLALGKTVDTLRTGDVARRAPDGLYEVIGRSSRFVKMYGLRIDLQRVEAALQRRRRDSLLHRGRRAARGCRGGPRRACRASITASASGLPAAAIRVVTVDELPLLPSGKPDYRPCRRSRARNRPGGIGCRPARRCSPMCCRSTRATIHPDQSFVDLGGNSLSYVAMSVRLERALGRLPVGLATRSLAELEASRTPARRRWPWLARRWRPAWRCARRPSC